MRNYPNGRQNDYFLYFFLDGTIVKNVVISAKHPVYVIVNKIVILCNYILTVIFVILTILLIQ